MIVGDAADDVAVAHRPAVGELHGEHVLPGGVAHHHERAARIESEQLVVRRARSAAEPDAAAPPAVGGELPDEHAVDQDVKGRVGIELLTFDLQLAVVRFRTASFTLPRASASTPVDASEPTSFSV